MPYKMSHEDYQCQIDLVKSRNTALKLTFEQAEQIFKYEHKGIHSEKHYLSSWEEWDYEFTSYKKILTEEQFLLFEHNHQEQIEYHRQQLIEQDKENLREIEYYNETIKYYEEQFLPGFFKDPLLFPFLLLSSDRAKVDYLKAEYNKYLHDSKKQILINHFREYRTYKPNGLEVSLLRHKLSYLWPNYSFFKSQMDEPTKAMAEYLKLKLASFQENYDELIIEKLQSLKVFCEENFAKYHTKSYGGWHTVIISKITPEEEREERIMSHLLLDREKYEW